MSDEVVPQAAGTVLPALPREEAWRVARLWESYEGELRVNFLRILGIFVFYAVHLINRHVLHVEGLTDAVHLGLTAVAAAWGGVALAVHVCLLRRVFPRWLRLLSVGADLLLLLVVLLLGDGPQSPMVVVLFLVLATTALRLDAQLVAFATAMAVAVYLVVVGNAYWWRPDTKVQRHEQLTVVAALVVMGVILGQVVRRARPVAETYAARLGVSGDAVAPAGARA